MIYTFSNPIPGGTVTRSEEEHKQYALDHGLCWKPAPKNQCPNGYYYIGVDVSKAGSNVEVLATCKQRIIMAELDKMTVADSKAGYGNQVRGQLDDGSVFIYAHLASFLVEVGDIVRPGQPIGIMGSTGNSSGPHAHIEHRVNGVPQYWWQYVGQIVQPPPPPPVDESTADMPKDMPLVRARWRLCGNWDYLSIRSGPGTWFEEVGRMKPLEVFDGVAIVPGAVSDIWAMAADGTFRAIWHANNQYLEVA